MRIENINGLKLEVYDSIEELPIKRFHKYNKMLLVDAGVGNDVGSLDAHLQKTIAFLKKKDNESAMTELNNLRQNFFLILDEISPRMLSFACLIKSINGVEQNDLSDDALSRVAERFADVPMNSLTSLLEEVKKKIDSELNIYFPQQFDDANTKEYYDILRRKILTQLLGIINSEDKTKEVQELTDLLVTYNNPRPFYGDKNVEIQHDKDFEKMCVAMAQKLNINPKELSVLEFYNSYEFMVEQMKAEKRALKRK